MHDGHQVLHHFLFRRQALLIEHQQFTAMARCVVGKPSLGITATRNLRAANRYQRALALPVLLGLDGNTQYFGGSTGI